MEKNNRGFSLVEFIIVIAILAVVGSLVTMGLSLATSKPADECAHKIVTSLNNARMTTMGKESVILSLYEKDDCIFAEETVNGTVTKTVQIGSKGVEVKYRLEGETSYQTLGDESDKLAFSFKRSSGGFNHVSEGGTSLANYCEEIVVTKGDRTKTITLAFLTGKVSVD